MDEITVLEVPVSSGEFRELVSEARLTGSTPERVAEGILRLHLRELRKIQRTEVVDPAAASSLGESVDT